MTVEAIKNAIAHLSEEERKQVADWLDETQEAEWQMEPDLAPGGRGAHLLDEVKADVAAGRIKPMPEFLAEAKAKREQSNNGK
jgi:hypothetical protein